MGNPDPNEVPLARRLGLFDATMIVMGGIIGAGIFVNPAVVARHVHTPLLVLGAWRTSTDPNAMVWEFSSDGSVLMGTNRGRYSFGNNNRIKIETSIATSVYQVELVGDKMTLTEPNGSKLVLTRVK